MKSLSRVQLFATPWTVAYEAPPSMEFSMQEYWSGLPFPSSGNLPDPGIQPGSPALQADALPSEPPGKPQKEGDIRKTDISFRNVNVSYKRITSTTQAAELHLCLLFLKNNQLKVIHMLQRSI